MLILNINIIKKIFPLKVGNVEKKNVIFKNFDLKINTGELICVFGPSGCGKTTLLNLISNLDNNFNGLISYNNKKITKEKIGYLFQSPRLFPWLTAKENIEFPIKQEKNSKKISSNLLQKIGLTKFGNSFPNKLSGGMQRRIALARAFSTQPKILLLDEPFVSLDNKIANQLRKLLINLWKQKKPTIIFVTHDLNEAIQLSDRIIFLSNLPAKILLDYKIKIKRPRSSNSVKFQSLKRLLSASVKP